MVVITDELAVLHLIFQLMVISTLEFKSNIISVPTYIRQRVGTIHKQTYVRLRLLFQIFVYKPDDRISLGLCLCMLGYISYMIE